MTIKETTALVTGASSGIGESIAKQLLENGCRVIGTSRDKQRLSHLQPSAEGRFFALELDVTDANSIETLFQRLPGQWREIDILVNNAGSDIGGRKPFHLGDSKHWRNTIETNVQGVIHLTHQLLPAMIKQDFGDIVNIGSTSGLRPLPTLAAYTASKHAMDGFSESLRMELEGTGIRVMQILPGMVRTGFAAARYADQKQGDQFYDDFGKWLFPEDVARTVIFALQQPRHMVVSRLVVVPKPV